MHLQNPCLTHALGMMGSLNLGSHISVFFGGVFGGKLASSVSNKWAESELLMCSREEQHGFICSGIGNSNQNENIQGPGKN